MVDGLGDGRSAVLEQLRPQANQSLGQDIRFSDPDVTADGAPRARVALDALETLWFATGSQCNIACLNCYIESSPTNDQLVYLTRRDVRAYLDEIAALSLGTREIGFTGGEPFLNPDILGMLGDALAAGHNVLVLTNAMQPMQRPKVKAGLLALKAAHGAKLTLRVSLDHHEQRLHEAERGSKTWAKALVGLDWLVANGFRIALAGRTCWQETEHQARDGYRRLVAERQWSVDVDDPNGLMLLPEMDVMADVPEVSTATWRLIDKAPRDVMCSTSRMVVKRKGAQAPTVLPCTLIPYDERFEMGQTLAEARSADGGMFAKGAVKLAHVHCAKFCVFGGGKCSGK